MKRDLIRREPESLFTTRISAPFDPPLPDPIDAAGVTIKKTTTGMVFGIYDQTCQAADANLVVENMGDYLMEQGM
jgi:hypothetical protein